jgi:hypothetical protein
MSLCREKSSVHKWCGQREREWAGGPAFRVLCEGWGCSAVTAEMRDTVLPWLYALGSEAVPTKPTAAFHHLQLLSSRPSARHRAGPPYVCPGAGKSARVVWLLRGRLCGDARACASADVTGGDGAVEIESQWTARERLGFYSTDGRTGSG